MSVFEIIQATQNHPEISAICGIAVALVAIKVIKFIENNDLNGEWTYGTVRLHDGRIVDPARKNLISGKCEFILWHRGEHGHVEDFWHEFGEGHSQNFVAYKSDD